MTLLLDEVIHLSIALLIGLVAYWRFRRWELLIAAIFFGFLIDFDHLFDYWHFFGLNFNPNDFFNANNYMKPSGKVYVPLHSWELVILFWLIARWFGKKLKMKGLEWAVSLSYLAHLVRDTFSFLGRFSLVYSLIYRLINNFEIARMTVLGR